MKAWLLALVVAQVVAAEGLQPSDVRGLQLDWEHNPQAMEVDGLPMTVQRATGAGVAALAQRIQSRWRLAGSQTRELQDGGWRLIARWDGTRSEVMQWRGAGDAAELLLSGFDARIQLPKTSTPPIHLPAGCIWGRQIRGTAPPHQYQQWTARCQGSVAQVLPQLRSLLTAGQWVITAASAAALHASRGGRDATLILVSGHRHSETWLVWISAGLAAGASG